MFGQRFYNETTRRYVAIFGTLFNDIKIGRSKDNINIDFLIDIPVNYGPMQKFLARFEQDPDFDADQNAFYYARVLQIPTPRHSLYDAIALGEEHAGTQPDTIQERAYTSAIWYHAQ